MEKVQHVQIKGTNVAKRGEETEKDNGLSFSVMKHFFFFFIL